MIAIGQIVNSYILPHPPIIIPEIGGDRLEAAESTVNAVKRAAEDIRNDEPDVIIITTPHGPVFQDYIHISDRENLEGDLGNFGAPSLKFSFTNATAVVSKIIKAAKKRNILCGGLDDATMKKFRISPKLDHGSLVPLYFINREADNFKLVHISIADMSFRELYTFGMCVAEAVAESDARAVFVASGDLSHRLSEDSPYEYNSNGKIFDSKIIDIISSNDVSRIFDIDHELCEAAGECGLRSFIMMYGALDGYELKSSLYSYAAPFGVGYAAARITPVKKNEERHILKKVDMEYTKVVSELRGNEDPYVQLARRSLETYINEGSILNNLDNLPEEMLNNRAGIFVSLKKHGMLRGCIGTTGPTRENLAQEIIHNAISAGTQDPRFDPVESTELGNIVYSVDVLNKPVKITSEAELDVVKYGVIVKAGSRSGLLLPNLEGVDTTEKQVSIALQKAGIKKSENYELFRFEVVRHK